MMYVLKADGTMAIDWELEDVRAALPLVSGPVPVVPYVDAAVLAALATEDEFDEFAGEFTA